MARVRKKVAEAAPAPVEYPLDWSPRTGSLPPVLTVDAVTKGAMPPLGTSAIPSTLEDAIPPELRFWKAATDDEARAVRDELVERAVVRASDVLIVDEQPCLVEWRAFAVSYEAPDAIVLAKRSSAGVAAAMRIAATSESARVVDAHEDAEPWTVERFAKTIEGIGTPTVFSLKASDRDAAQKAGLTTFELATRAGIVFATTSPLDPEAEHVERVSDRSDTEMMALAKRALALPIRLLKADAEAPAPAEERYVLGVVLEPDVIDTQSDTYSAETVRKAAHRFMENFAQMGLQHAEIVTGKLKILESYVAPVDFAIGTEKVKAGTWLLAFRVVDDALWTAIKAGDYTGLSIGGTAVKRPDTGADQGVPDASAPAVA